MIERLSIGRLLRWATRLVSAPAVLDFAYGTVGRIGSSTLRKAQMTMARIRRVPLKQFNRSYFFPGKVLQLNVTNVCNARCSFCAYRLVADTDRATGVMKMETFQKAIDEF